ILRSHRVFFFLSSRRRNTRSKRDWSSDVCSSDLCVFAYASIIGVYQVILVGLASWTWKHTQIRIARTGNGLMTWPATVICIPLKIGRASCREREYITKYDRSVRKDRDSK